VTFFIDIKTVKFTSVAYITW